VQNVKDESMVAVAHLRLATIQLDQKHYDAALAELGQAHPSAFDALFLDLRAMCRQPRVTRLLPVMHTRLRLPSW
jgi:predicted negative regulator of RcsB-dependent stress response